MIRVIMDGEPVGKRAPQLRRTGGAYTPEKARTYETSLAWAAKTVMGSRPPLDVPLHVCVMAYMARPAKKPDIDNIAKAALDALNKIVWTDDMLVVSLEVGKILSDKPRIEITVEPD